MSTPDTTSNVSKPNESSSSTNQSPATAMRRPAPSDSASTPKKAKVSTPFDVESVLECTICLDFASSPIMICDNTHILCGQCAPKFKTCPTCKNPKIRLSLLGEKLAKEANRKIDCLFSESGCKEGVLSTKFVEHLPLCDYRDIRCVQMKCTDKLPFNKYFEHLVGKHKIMVLNGPNFTTSFLVGGPDPGVYPQFIAKLGNLDFVVHACVKENVFYSWVSILGSKETGGRYSCKITLFIPGCKEVYGCVWAISILPYHEIPSISTGKIEKYKIFKIPMPSLDDWGVEIQTDNGRRVRFHMKYEIREIIKKPF